MNQILGPRTNGQNNPALGQQGLSTFPQEMSHHPVETAATAAAAQAEAAVKARYQMALLRPRNIDQVRLRLLSNCRRTSFAEVAKYSKPIGSDKVVGPSIRFVEQALRDMGNTYVESMVIYDDAAKRIVRVCCMDLECNLSYPQDIVIEKKVERSYLKEGQQSLGQRINSKGRVVHLVEATEDDMLNKSNNLISKAIRSNGLRLIPGDIVDEAMNLVDQTLSKEGSQDPDAYRKKLLDNFFRQGVTPENLDEYLGHSASTTNPAEIQELYLIFTAIKDGETTWNSVIAQRQQEKGEGAGTKPGTEGAKNSEDLKARLKEKAGKKDSENVEKFKTPDEKLRAQVDVTPSPLLGDEAPR